MIEVGAAKKSRVTPAAAESAVSDSENDIADISVPEMRDAITPYQLNFISEKIIADLKLRLPSCVTRELATPAFSLDPDILPPTATPEVTRNNATPDVTLTTATPSVPSPTPAVTTAIPPVKPFDSTVRIEEGPHLYRNTTGSKNDVVRVQDSRSRWQLKEEPVIERKRWSILMEAIRMDYVQSGPDFPISGLNQTIRPDDRVATNSIKNRYEQIFGANAPPMSPRQWTAV